MNACDTIRKNKTDIVRILFSNLILEMVKKNHLITNMEYKNLKRTHCCLEWNLSSDLLDMIMLKGVHTCQMFLDLLQHDEKVKEMYPDLKELNLNYSCQHDSREHESVEDWCDLILRLNDEEYINWLKAVRCLLILKEDLLLPYITKDIEKFHKDLLKQNPDLNQRCENSCQIKGKKLSCECTVCREWKEEIRNHRRRQNAYLYWDNCNQSSWRNDHWELAKAYMPPGQVNVHGDKFDTAALLSLIKNCDVFISVDLKPVNQMIYCRNALMHSSDHKMSDEWMESYENTLENLVQQFKDFTDITTVKHDIDETLNVDLSILVPYVDISDVTSHADVHQRMKHDSVKPRHELETKVLQKCEEELKNASVTQIKQKKEVLAQFKKAYENLCKAFPSPQ